MAYKTQRMPYVAVPESDFASTTLSAFREILKIVTAQWEDSHVEGWNELVADVSTARKLAEVAERKKRRPLAVMRANPRLQVLFAALAIVTVAAISWAAFESGRGADPGTQAGLTMLVTAYDNDENPRKRVDALKELLEQDQRAFPSIDLSGMDLSGVDFHQAVLRGAKLSESNLQGVNFEGADLRDADLRYALLQGVTLKEANLARTNLTDATIDLGILSARQLAAAIVDGKD